MKLAIAQLKHLIGGIESNAKQMIEAISYARDELNADMIVFSELSLSGYPPEDLLFNHACKERVAKALDHICQHVNGIDVVLGYPRYSEDKLFNSACIIQNGKIQQFYDKQILPNNSVFDEKRYFTEGQQALVFNSGGIKFGLLICEDIWAAKPSQLAKQAGAEVLLSIHASPFVSQKIIKRHAIAKQRIDETALPLIYVPSVGGQDELIFDGGAFVMNSQGQITQSLSQFSEEISLLCLNKQGPKVEPLVGEIATLIEPVAELYEALKLAVKDYINKNHFPGAIIGLSGGIDSALTLAIAVDALGADKVKAILMPSRFTADMSIEDAIKQAEAMQVSYQIIEIEPIYESLINSLSPSFEGHAPDLTEENLQARCRGTLLMALSNKTGKLVLTTSNKSEVAVGYSTLYGDMAGGFNVLKDLYKTQVYQLAVYRNKQSQVIPERVISRAPSAELRHNQTDQDSLPDYPTLDAILKAYIEDNLSETEIIEKGFAPSMVSQVIHLIKRSEYKRYQAPIGPKLSQRAFGKDWRNPVTSAF
ncbi:MAG: synthase [Gammaproteobacteria bacterium]|jgi:NAD+ synthase (glutamine-hydrolysing)|nr:synthase [Gammaproteobacteria bacterium]